MVEEEEEVKAGAPEWMTTYADLMSLLMCFFVLLLSFSEMDVNKYKRLAGSMKQAFGVQNEMRLKQIPKGTSIIAKEFSPGRPSPMPATTIKQQSTNTVEDSLDIRTSSGKQNDEDDPNSLPNKTRMIAEELNGQFARRIQEKLAEQIAMGNIKVQYDHNAISVRIREQGSFPSGSADMTKEFLPVIPILQQALVETPGAIAVEGHTDNVPIYNLRFKSNWELSSQRALSFAHALMKDARLEPNRFMVVGYADSRPLAPNKTWQERAENRRVEILIRRSPEHAKFGL